MHAIPNGGKRGKREAAILKREGVTAGVADLFLPWPQFDSGGKLVYCGLYIEIKAGKDVLRDSQKKFREHCEAAKYKFVVVRNAQDGIDSILEYIGVL